MPLGLSPGNRIKEIVAQGHGVASRSGLRCGHELDLANLQDAALLRRRRRILAVRRARLGRPPRPIRWRAPDGRVIAALAGKRRQHRQQHFAQFGPFEGGSGADQRRNPQQIAQAFGRFHLDRFDVREGNPQIGAGREDFQARADPRIGVLERFEWLAVERPPRSLADRGGLPGSSSLLKQFRARSRSACSAEKYSMAPSLASGVAPPTCSNASRRGRTRLGSTTARTKKCGAGRRWGYP